MPARIPLLLTLALLAGAAAAFAVTEHLKLEQPPIRGPVVERAFAPGCRCPNPTATVSFRLPKRDVVTASVLDARGRVVRRLLDHVRRFAGRVTLVWNGRNENGDRVADGVYRYRIRLQRRGRTILLPFGSRADTVAPRVTVVSAFPVSFHAGIDGRSERVKVRYRVSEKATVLVFVDGERRVRSRFHRRRGELDWYARKNGKALPPGNYRLWLVAQDLAGNRSQPTPVIRVRIRPRD